MNGLIYLIGLIVVIMAILHFLDCTRRWRLDPISESPERIGAGFGLTWGPAIAGAIAASALALVLDSFGLAMDWLLVLPLPRGAIHRLPLYFCPDSIWCLRHSRLTVLAAHRRSDAARYDPGELPEFQDGMHGLIVWGIATLFAGLIAAITLSLFPRYTGSGGGTPSDYFGPGETLIGFELDRLFRGSEDAPEEI